MLLECVVWSLHSVRFMFFFCGLVFFVLVLLFVCFFFLFFCFFCFQAEDGIRDLVRSRGLGDVYKRQAPRDATLARSAAAGGGRRAAGRRAQSVCPGRAGAGPRFARAAGERRVSRRPLLPVSYTHLALPTSDLV